MNATMEWIENKIQFFLYFRKEFASAKLLIFKTLIHLCPGKFWVEGPVGTDLSAPPLPQSCTDTHKSLTFFTVIEVFEPFHLVSLQNRVDPALLYHLPINFRECNENEVQLYNKILERHACDYVN